MSSPYFERLNSLISQHGTLQEQQLVGRWKAELSDFLQTATSQLLNGLHGLEIGIEDAMTLKLTIKAKSLCPATTLLSFMETSPTLVPWGRHILQHQLRFHCGIKLTPDRFSRELYCYPTQYEKLEGLLASAEVLQEILRIRPLGIGIDDKRGYSIYYTSPELEWVEVLRKELGLSEWHAKKLWPWQQVRFDGDKALPGKTALELTPLSPKVLARLASHYPFPNFRYLIPLREYANGNFGRDPATGRFALYAQIN